MCGNPARKNDYEQTWHHTAVLRGLAAGTTYTYCVGDHSDSACSTFTTAPEMGTRESYSFVMYGDMGVPKGQHGKSPGCASPLLHEPFGSSLPGALLRRWRARL